jgi:hypothetical protein
MHRQNSLRVNERNGLLTTVIVGYELLSPAFDPENSRDLEGTVWVIP